jgi:hypothetical protein
MKSYPRWESIPRDHFDGSIPELAEKYAVHCVNAYPKLLAVVKAVNGVIASKEATELLEELGEQ